MKKILHKTLFISILITYLIAQTLSINDWSMSIEKQLVESISQNDLARKVYSQVVSNLRLEGISPDYIQKIFDDPGIKIVDEITNRFKNPAERLSYERYRKIFITDNRIKNGKKFLRDYGSLIRTVSDSFSVDPFVIVSIVGIESLFGNNAKQYVVFNALHTIIHQIPRKEKWAEKEMSEYLMFCYNNNTPPLTIYGSYAGAFGYGQFIPSSYNHYAVDFDKDGVKDPFHWPDVLASVANYLKKHGYDDTSEDYSKNSNNWKALMAYNPSTNYVRVVMEFREKLKVTIGDKRN